MRGIAPRAGPIAVLHRVLWFLTLWHLVTVWIWAWNGAGSEAVMKHEEEEEEEGDGPAACGAACGAGLETRLASEAGGDSVDMWTGKGDGSVCVQDGRMPGGQGGGVQ